MNEKKKNQCINFEFLHLTTLIFCQDFVEISCVGMLNFQIFMNIFAEILCKGAEHPDLKVSLIYPFFIFSGVFQVSM